MLVVLLLLQQLLLLKLQLLLQVLLQQRLRCGRFVTASGGLLLLLLMLLTVGELLLLQLLLLLVSVVLLVPLLLLLLPLLRCGRVVVASDGRFVGGMGGCLCCNGVGLLDVAGEVSSDLLLDGWQEPWSFAVASVACQHVHCVREVAEPTKPSLFREWRLVVCVDLLVTRLAACSHDRLEGAALRFPFLACAGSRGQLGWIVLVAGDQPDRIRAPDVGVRVLSVLLFAAADMAAPGAPWMHVAAAEPPAGPAGGLWLRWLRWRW